MTPEPQRGESESRNVFPAGAKPAPVPEEFILSVSDNLGYWQQRARDLPESRFTELDDDWPNIRKALQFALAIPEHRLAAAELARALFVYIERRALWREWIPLLRTLISTLDIDQPSLKLSLLIELGQCLRLDWQLAEALAVHREAETLAGAPGNEAILARVLFNLCEDHRLAHAYAEAEKAGAVALALFAEHKPDYVADVLNSLGFIAHTRGNYGLAEVHLVRAVELFRQTTRPVDLTRTLTNLANALAAQGKHEAALTTYDEAARILKNLGSELEIANIHLWRGTLLFTLGRLTEAERAFELADSPGLRRTGNVQYRALIANNLGNVYLAQSRIEAAVERLQTGIDLWRQIGEEVQLGNTLGTLGEAEAARGQVADAVRAYDEALEHLSRYPDNAWARKLHTKYTAQCSALIAREGLTYAGAIRFGKQ
jgi:tetratricopeptide (TPR) repeat protein